MLHSFRPKALLPAAATFVLILGISIHGSVQQGRQTFRSGITEIPVDVRVMDSLGRPVTDLTREDFTLYEDDVEQQIAHFSRHIMDVDAPQPGLRMRANAPVFSDSGRPQNHRVFLIALGSGSLSGPSDPLKGLLHLVRDRLLPQDQIALLAYNRATDFTTDHERIANILERFRISEASGAAAFATEVVATTGRGTVDRLYEPPPEPFRDDGMGLAEFVGANSRTMSDADALEYGVKYLRYMEGEKHLVYVTAQGMPRPAPNLRQPEGTGKAWIDPGKLAEMASNGRVVVDTIQTGGIPGGGDHLLEDLGTMKASIVVPDAPGQNPIFFSRKTGDGGTSGGGEKMTVLGARRPENPTGGDESGKGGVAALSARSNLPGFTGSAWGAIQDLRIMSDLTGGQASIMDYADKALDRIDATTRSYYLLGYYPTNGVWDGSYRKIAVRVNRPGLTVLFRHGYYAELNPAPFDRRTFLVETRIASAAYQTTDVREVPLTVNTSLVMSPNRTVTAVRTVIGIDGSRLSLVQDGNGRFVGQLIAIVACGDAWQIRVGEQRETIDLSLTSASYEKVRRGGLTHEMKVAVRRKPTFVKVIVYDYAANLLGSSMQVLK